MSQNLIPGNTEKLRTVLNSSVMPNNSTGSETRARICKRLRSSGIGSEESIPPAYVARWAGTTIGLSYRAARLGIDSWAP